eukprot:624415_1
MANTSQFIPDHIARWIMDLVSPHPDVEQSYGVLRKSYLMCFSSGTASGEKVVAWKQYIQDKLYPNHNTTPKISYQAMESVLSSLDNSLKQYKENCTTNNQKPAIIQMNIIQQQTVTEQNVTHQHVAQQTVVTQNINVLCDLKRYSATTIECNQKSPVKVIIPSTAKFNSHAILSHTNQTSCTCMETDSELEFTCKTCNDGVKYKCQVMVIQNKKSIKLPLSWTQHLDENHRLSLAKYNELKMKKKKKKKNEHDRMIVVMNPVQRDSRGIATIQMKCWACWLKRTILT